MARFWALALSIVCAGGVAWYVWPQPRSWGYAGLEFAAMTPGAEARAPLLTSRGALIYEVADDSPAAKAGIHAGEVAVAIDGAPLASARDASDIVRRHAAGDRITLTLIDTPQGEIHSRQVTLLFAAAPPITRRLSVRPPRTLASEYFYPPGMAANASWSRRIARGPTIRPHALFGLGAGRCNGFAPEEWIVRGHAPDDTMIHVAARHGFQHAIYLTAKLDGRDPMDFIRAVLEKNFQAPAVTTPPQLLRPFDFILFDFGNRNGAAGFAEYRVTEGRIALWIAAVPGADVAWAKPLAGAVALSLNCESALSPPPVPMAPPPTKTSVSVRCLEGRCEESDFAAAYLETLRFGYVHNAAGEMFLINPRRDLWQNGAEGPGFYRQIGGENEKLLPGRIN